MRKICGLLICLVILCTAVTGVSETVTFQTFSADSEAEYLNLDTDIQRIQNWNAFYEFLAQFPNLKKVDMFNVPLHDQKPHDLHNRFPDVEFGMTMVFEEHTIRTDQTDFSTLHGYNPKWHNCAQLSVVKYCKNLYALDIDREPEASGIPGDLQQRDRRHFLPERHAVPDGPEYCGEPD